MLITRNKYTLEETVAIWRGETRADPRPNKALNPDMLSRLLEGYALRKTVVDVAKHGVYHEFALPFPASKVQVNHRSAELMHNALVRSLRVGQDDGTYLIVDSEVVQAWSGIQFSPFGCVEKKDADPSFEARLIHDLSYPKGFSTNDLSTRHLFPPLQYRHVSALARRIEQLRSRGAVVKMLKGDVKGAFRHIPLSSRIVRWFAGSLPAAKAIILDLALPFGWSGSPAYYGAFGNAISWLVGRETPATLNPTFGDTEPFFAYEWVDDHILLEVDRGDRLMMCETALRLAMMAVLGPRAINESKFSSWETELTALGLEWNTATGTVSMPLAKIAKAQLRLQAALRSQVITRKCLDKLLGSLRHVCSCIRPAKPFYQRLVALYRRCGPHTPMSISDGARLDLLWFDYIVSESRLRHVPTSMFCDVPTPDVHLYMDASDQGLCVLHPAIRQYIRVRFDTHEQVMIQNGPDANFTINVREQLSAVFALVCWFQHGCTRPDGRPLHVRCWLDNRSAVAWCNGLASLNPFGQELNRVIGLFEADFGLRLSAEHLPGSSNIMADLGSHRSRDPPQDLRSLVLSFQQRSLAESSRRAYAASWNEWVAFCNDRRVSPWLPQQDPQAQSLRLILFAAHCWSRFHAKHGRPPRFDTVRSKLSHIAWRHRLECGFSPSLHEGHQLALRGMRRSSTPCGRQDPVTSVMLSAIARRLDLSKPHQRVYLGAALVGFFFLLRRSEYLEVDGRQHHYCLQVDDVAVTDSEGNETLMWSKAKQVRVRFRGSKNDQDGSGTSRVLFKTSQPPLCPVFGALLLKKNARRVNLTPTDPICSLDKSRTLSARQLMSFLRASPAVTNQDKISSHSLRIGGATALFKAGAPIQVIKMHGRWRSSAFERYTRYTETVARSLAESMAGTQAR